MIVLAGLQQILWPVHCVQNTAGADFAPGLDRAHITHIARKGTDPTIDSYSGFFDNGHRRATDLGDYLKTQGITDVYILGLATDYCVKFTALDAVQLGLQTYLIEDGCRGVNLQPGDVQRAIEEMRNAGVRIIDSRDMSGTINFYSVNDEYGCFSNFAPYPIRLDGKNWPTTEHYFQAQKFEDSTHQEAIRTTKSPMIAARMGRDRKKKLRRDWESVKVSIMTEAVPRQIRST